MKDKKTVLLELEELKALRDELRDEVSVITVDLAKERTKVHALKDEVYKLKVGFWRELLKLQLFPVVIIDNRFL